MLLIKIITLKIQPRFFRHHSMIINFVKHRFAQFINFQINAKSSLESNFADRKWKK